MVKKCGRGCTGTFEETQWRFLEWLHIRKPRKNWSFILTREDCGRDRLECGIRLFPDPGIFKTWRGSPGCARGISVMRTSEAQRRGKPFPRLELGFRIVLARQKNFLSSNKIFSRNSSPTLLSKTYCRLAANKQGTPNLLAPHKQPL